MALTEGTDNKCVYTHIYLDLNFDRWARSRAFAIAIAFPSPSGPIFDQKDKGPGLGLGPGPAPGPGPGLSPSSSPIRSKSDQNADPHLGSNFDPNFVQNCATFDLNSIKARSKCEQHWSKFGQNWIRQICLKFDRSKSSKFRSSFLDKN